MGETENAANNAKPLGLVRLLPDNTAADVQKCFQDAFADREEFSSVMILAVVDCEDDTQIVRVYSTTMGHLEKLGLAEKAKTAID
jgi:hypothetical protein